MLKGNAVIGQSGGPTSVINASLAGLVTRILESGSIDHILGMRFGMEGLLAREFFDLGKLPKKVLQELPSTPSSILGSSRYKLQDSDFPPILKILKKYNIRYFFLIGGNDTMDSIHRVEAYCRTRGYDLFAIGIPKTVDNDLFGTDFTPGFPSAARSNILNVRQAGILARDMRKVDKFVVYQTIGREAGWLAAATALARQKEGDAPHLIYCPEIPVTKDALIEDARACIDEYGWVSMVVSEGLLYPDGQAVSASSSRDKFNNTEFGAMGGASAAMNIHRILTDALEGARGEFQIPESLIMSAFDRVEPLDLDMAFASGIKAAELALLGNSGLMVGIKRQETGEFTLDQLPLSEVALQTKVLPRNYLNARGNDVSPGFLEYMKPLISELPAFMALEEQFHAL